jgi:hypothetical protein
LSACPTQPKKKQKTKNKKPQIMALSLSKQVLALLCLASAVTADKLFSDETIVIEDPKNVAIDFSSAVPGMPDAGRNFAVWANSCKSFPLKVTFLSN